MIVKINKIKKLGLVFQDYSRKSGLPYFKAANVIYGWNGTGKTTLSRLFDALGGTPFPDLEYEVEDDQSAKHVNTAIYPQKIRVFNQDYISKNVKVLEGRANSISILLGKENKELIDKIESDKKLLAGDPDDLKTPGKLVQEKDHTQKSIQKSLERDGKFTEIAKTIGAAMGGNALRTYRKQQAQQDFAKLDQKAELNTSQLNDLLMTARQESLAEIQEATFNDIKQEDEIISPAKLLSNINQEAAKLLKKTAESIAIKRLTDNSDISDWVEQGVALHKEHSSKTCEYCKQKIPVDRMKELASHFNDADKKIKENIDKLVGQLQVIYANVNSLELADKARFYNVLQANFEAEHTNYGGLKISLLTDITDLAEELKAKKSKTTEVVAKIATPDLKHLNDKIIDINKIVQMHNKTTTDFESVKKESIDKLKAHYLSTIFDEVNTLDGEIQVHNEEANTLATEIASIEEEIAEAMSQISSDHKACEHINEKLSVFLGHQELKFVPHSEKEIDEDVKEKEMGTGYDIMRGDKLATNLSEGEKTAIAFVYFVVHLGDRDFEIKDGIVVIDDPISSLDSNSLYQAFSFLKNSVKDAGQVFIMTHNFDFLKLLLNWRQNVNHGKTTGFFMIKNTFPHDVRCASVEQMDKELCNYESEYHYLFKLLKTLRSEQDDSIARAYPIPNIARKVWDTFTMFRVPSGDSPYKKVEALKAEGYDEIKLDAIYKFTNDQSHITGAGFDPALVASTKKVIDTLFEMMKTISPEHYKIIDEATN